MRSQPDDLIVSHASAVALLGLPWIGSFGERLVVSDPARDRGQVKATTQRVGTASRVPDTVRIDGIAVTSPIVTAVDVALREHPWRAIVVLDAVLRRGEARDALLAELDRRPGARARARARDLIEHADAAAESPGESITRWGAHVLGAPEPVLQHGFPNDGGGTERVDLFFPGSGTVVEFDGVAKYTDPRYRGGRSSQEVVVAEKRREDRLRAQHDVRGFARVGWADSMPSGQLPRRLLEAGVPLSPNWGSAWRAAAVRAL
ncbi:hypothetical protein BIU98_13795 [Curtobacterium sp. MMLR14_010]|nr:hypothetical protein BIU98_13795 [Curtobacterium sp. MMLR14_010]